MDFNSRRTTEIMASTESVSHAALNNMCIMSVC